MKQINVPDLHALDKAAEEFVSLIGSARIIAISGEMGAGKTTFIQALCRVLGVSQIVTSPTFALVNEYFTNEGESVYHFDLYRIENPEELFDIGYEDYLFSGAYCFIEWPEKASALIPAEALHVDIKVEDDEKRMIIVEDPETKTSI
jgi:tRNA threonylcarbamoyladenosine biosynthesis protein TsaE